MRVSTEIPQRIELIPETDEDDVIQQVAEAKCPSIKTYTCIGVCSPRLGHHHPDLDHESCCQGTGLRWPPLSRECRTPDGILDCLNLSLDHKHGRIPDVTLEKVSTIVGNQGINMSELDGVWWCEIGDGRWKTGRGNTPLEAACAALLASVEVKE